MEKIFCIDHNGKNFEKLRVFLKEQGFSWSELDGVEAARTGTSRYTNDGYLDLIENAPVGIFRSTVEGKFLSVNPAVARMLKYDSPKEMVRLVNRIGIAEAVYVDPAHWQDVLESILTHGGWKVFEERFRCKDGSVIICNFHLRSHYADDGRVELHGFTEDITERKRTEEALKLSQFIIDKASLGIFRGSDDARILAVNDYWARILGYTPEELCSLSFFDIDPNLTPEFWRAHRKKLSASGSHTFESVHRRKDGTEFPVEVTVNYFKYGDQEFSCSFATDISERKSKEEALRFTQFAIDKTIDQAFWVTEDAHIFYVNDAACQSLGYSREELVGMSIPDIGPTFPAEVFAEFWRELREKGSVSFESWHRAKNGRVYPVEIRSTYVVFDGKEYSCAFATDISERKQVEEALRESEHRYREVFENTSDCMFLLDVTWDGRFKFAGFNPAEEKAVSFLSADTAGKFVEEIIPRELADQVLANYRRCVEAGTTINYEEQLNLPVGVRYFQTILIPVRNSMGDIYRIIGISHDITESRRADEALRQANLVVENSPVVLFRWREAEGWPVEMVTRNVTQFGYPPEELMSGAISFSSMVYHEDLARVVSEVEDYIRHGEDQFQQEYRIVTREGDIRWIDDRTVVERDAEGKVTHYQGIVIDITDRKRTERVMATRIRLLQFASTHTLDELLEATLNEVEELTSSCIGFYHYLEADQQTLSLQNWSTRTKKEFCTASGKGLHYDVSVAGVWVDCVHERRPVIHNDYASLSHRKGLPPGHPPVLRELVVPVFSGENIVAILGVGNKPRDYTHQDMEMVSLLADFVWEIVVRKRAEEALKISEQQYRTIIEHAPFGITRSTMEGKLVSANPALAGILKYDSPEDLLETVNCSSIQKVLFVKPSEREQVVNRIFEGTAWRVFECQYRCKDGSVITCKVHSRRILDQEGSDREFESFMENVTDRVEAEKALRESEEKFRVLAETAPAAIVVYQGENFVYVNPAAVRLFGYDEAELLEMKFWEWAHPESRTMVMERGMARQRGEPVPVQYEHRFVNKKGEEGWVMVSAGSITYRGNPAGIATFIDITEIKRAEERVQAALAEKVVLLKEVHHRVKNNLQIVSSLLELQSDYIEGDDARRYFRESQDRIRSMALVHEQLYNSEDLSVIDFASYAEELVMSLYRSSVVDQDKISTEVEVRDFELGIDEAIPCGLIINELVSNALEHAFPGDRRGTVLVRGSLDEKGYVCLSVTDTGVGLPQDFDFSSLESLGLQIVSLLTKQLYGTFEILGDNGVTVTIRFKSRAGK